MLDKIKYVIMGLVVAALVLLVLLGAYPSLVDSFMNLSDTGLSTWQVAYKNAAPFILIGFIVLVVVIAIASGGKK